jgi:hypothetical protein
MMEAKRNPAVGNGGVSEAFCSAAEHSEVTPARSNLQFAAARGDVSARVRDVRDSLIFQAVALDELAVAVLTAARRRRDLKSKGRRTTSLLNEVRCKTLDDFTNRGAHLLLAYADARR